MKILYNTIVIIRRSLILLLGLLLVLTFVFAINIQYEKKTFFNSQYYYDQLEKLQFYDFISDDLITAVLSDLYNTSKIPLEYGLPQKVEASINSQIEYSLNRELLLNGYNLY